MLRNFLYILGNVGKQLRTFRQNRRSLGKKRKFLTEKSCEKKFYWKYDLGKRYKIELNDNYQILRSLKKVLRA